MSLGFYEILLIVAVILLLFGAKRIPDLARALGRASHEFKKAKDEIKRESADLLDAAEKEAAKKDAASPRPSKTDSDGIDHSDGKQS